VSDQVQYHSRHSMDWRGRQTLNVDTSIPLIEEGLLNWETSILRHYFEWWLTRDGNAESF
jgi:hypothetical protein